MGLDETLNEIEKSTTPKPITPIEAQQTLRGFSQIQEFVNFIARADSSTIETIARCIQALKQGFIDDCDLDESITSSDTIEAMRQWPELMTFIDRWMSS